MLAGAARADLCETVNENVASVPVVASHRSNSGKLMRKYVQSVHFPGLMMNVGKRL